MKIKELENAFLVRLERGEELIASLRKFAKETGLHGGFFHGLGGASKATLGVYTLSEDKQYHFTGYEGDLEIISMNGNIALDEPGEVIVHCHAAISGTDLKAVGGHVKTMIVAGTAEIFVDTRTGTLSRKLDEDTGLTLLDLDD